ncbi:MAG: 4-hydroxy-3-methylbut-2-enyl diphosphate reductase [Phycisphaerales bacterium]|nr:MAG: 4-hydroxy-3-methylbut-2-enyl diphosphate reductase [Phycisphaerales bacterium]
MKLILANPRGFCAGVYMAIDVVNRLLEVCEGEPIYVYHEIVHNRHVVERFRLWGVTFVDDLAEVPEGSIVVFSAHGVSPQIRRQADQRRLRVVDASCPLVMKVHAEAIRYAKKGYQILLIGHPDHQEVIGTRGEAPEAIQVVESVQDIPSLRIKDPGKLVYLTQTTLSLVDAQRIVAALKRQFPGIKDPPSEDICYATTNRQSAVRALAPGCDLVLVVGSKNSSNSQRLREIAQATGTRAELIDDMSELKAEWFEKVKSILITAGASAPEDLVQDLIFKLIEDCGGEVELSDVHRETTEFGLPGTLKEFMRRRGVDPEVHSVQMDSNAAMMAWLDFHGIPHRHVDLTVGESQ